MSKNNDKTAPKLTVDDVVKISERVRNARTLMDCAGITDNLGDHTPVTYRAIIADALVRLYSIEVLKHTDQKTKALLVIKDADDFFTNYLPHLRDFIPNLRSYIEFGGQRVLPGSIRISSNVSITVFNLDEYNGDQHLISVNLYVNAPYSVLIIGDATDVTNNSGLEWGVNNKRILAPDNAHQLGSTAACMASMVAALKQA